MIRSFFSICLLIALFPSLLIYSIDNYAFIVTNIDLPEPLYPTIAIFMFGPIKFRFIKIQAGLFQNLIPLAIILIEEIYTQG